MNPTILLDHDAPSPDGRLVVRALLRIEGQAPADASRIPLNLSLVLDRSGSMSGEKLAAARDAARLVVRRLWPEDLVSVVAFDDAVQVVAPPSRGAEAPDLARRVAAIEPGGMTNLSGGWLKGLELTTAGRRDAALNRIILLTDGHANVGITDPAALAGLCQTAAAGGVSTTTVGFGEGFDERLLGTMADAGGGNTYYIERPDQAMGVFEEELEGLLSLTAQNLSVEVRPAGDARLVAVHHSFPSTDVDGGLRLELGDLYAREPRAVLVEFALDGPAGADELALGTLVIRADVLTPGGGVERREVTCPVRMVPGEGPRVEPEVRREMLLIQTARARETALTNERHGDFAAAADALRSVAYSVRESEVFLDDRLREEAEDLERMAARSIEGPMSLQDKKYLNQRAYEASRGKREAYKRVKRDE